MPEYPFDSAEAEQENIPPPDQGSRVSQEVQELRSCVLALCAFFLFLSRAPKRTRTRTRISLSLFLLLSLFPSLPLHWFNCCLFFSHVLPLFGRSMMRELLSRMVPPGPESGSERRQPQAPVVEDLAASPVSRVDMVSACTSARSEGPGVHQEEPDQRKDASQAPADVPKRRAGSSLPSPLVCVCASLFFSCVLSLSHPLFACWVTVSRRGWWWWWCVVCDGRRWWSAPGIPGQQP